MKQGIHPDYVPTTVTCTCGNTFTTRSTKPGGEIRVELAVDRRAETRRHAFRDDLEIQRLKKQKLHIKEEITRLSAH